MSSRDTRREENQKLFRLGNERLDDFLDDDMSETQRVPFLCECAADWCDSRVEVRLSDWEVVSSEPNLYLIVAGHLRSEGEEVVGSLGEYQVVRRPDPGSGERSRSFLPP
jgi:hypothetical protein